MPWAPFPDREDGTPSPQRLAYESPADEVFFGGAAGSGKSFLLLGLALTAHSHTIIFRREYPQLKGLFRQSRQLVNGRGRFSGASNTWTLDDGRVIEFGAVQHEDDREKYQGRPHDLIGFDELPHFSRTQYRFLIGWNRNDGDTDQRCRVLCTGNPPTTPEGRWVVQEWAPWLDPQFPDPAEPGELRYYAVLDGELVWLKDGQEYVHRRKGADGTEAEQVIRFRAGGPFDFVNERGQTEAITARSRTFIPGRVTDNPVLMKQGYQATLQGMPEPLRSQMLYGDFNAGVEDDQWQVIPTEWVRLAQARWTEEPPCDPTAYGVDPARGGRCKTVISRRHGAWYACLKKYPGTATPDGPHVAGLVAKELSGAGAAERTPVHLDVIGIGSAVHDIARQQGLNVHAINVAMATAKKDRHRNLNFRNLRAYAWWAMREALDPQLGDAIALPPDPELLADLTAPRWFYGVGGVQIEAKEDVAERIGRSPDCADAVVLASIPPRPSWKLEVY